MDEGPEVGHRLKKAPESCDENFSEIESALTSTEELYFSVGTPTLKSFMRVFLPKERPSEYFKIQVSHISSACLEEFKDNLQHEHHKIDHSRLNCLASAVLCSLCFVTALTTSPPPSDFYLQAGAFVVFCVAAIFLGYFALASSWTNRKTSFLFLINDELKRRAGGGGPFSAIINDS